MAELHSDGHLITGLWSFPLSPAQGDTPAVCEVHYEAFRDFGALGGSV